MARLKDTIETAATRFADEVVAALRGASIEELVAFGAQASRSHGGTTTHTTHHVAAPRAAAAHTAKPAAAKAVKAVKAAKAHSSKSGGRIRRSAGDIGKLTEKIVSLVASTSGGLRAEQIRESLGVQKAAIVKPIADALATGTLTKKGEKRATTYFAAHGEKKGQPKKSSKK